MYPKFKEISLDTATWTVAFLGAIEERETKSKKPFCTFHLLDGAIAIIANLWNTEKKDIYKVQEKSVISVQLYKKLYNGVETYEVKEYQAAPDDAKLEDYLLTAPIPSQDMMDEIKSILSKEISETELYPLVMEILDENADKLVKMILEKKMSMEEYRNTSILYRTNKEAVQVSDLLITEKIPFWCTEPIQDKYDHWIYRDILSYHKLGIGIGNKMDLNRILNHPQRFLFDPRFFKTDGSLKQLMHVAATLPDGKWKRSKAMDSMEDMFYLFKKLEDKSPVDTLQILESFGRYKIFLHDYAEYRNMSPGELYFFWNSYKADAEKHNDWKEWDAYVRKHKIILQEQLRKHDGIALSTLHRSKGLEWDRVYILNCVKNTIPFAKQGTVEDLEEERRLFYVGCTRAKKELQLLSYQGNSGEISPFIKELKSSESDTSDKVDLDVHLKY